MGSFLDGGLGGLATGLLGGVAGAIGQSSANAANKDIAEEQMRFQADQSSTAYQRATTDMQKAGINPMLAYMQGGASSGAGASAQMGNVGAAGVSSAQSAMQARQANAATDQAEAQAEQAKNQADKTLSEKFGVDKDNSLKDFYAKLAAKNSASTALTASKAGTNSWYNSAKQLGSDLGGSGSIKQWIKENSNGLLWGDKKDGE